jgi:uncharacterized membrane protein
MVIKNFLLVILITVLALFASCAVVPGPPVPLGLGPVFDQLVPLLLICLAAVLVWKYGLDILRRYKNPNGTDQVDETPERTIRRRYARGEVTRDQFLQMPQDLERKP